MFASNFFEAAVEVVGVEEVNLHDALGVATVLVGHARSYANCAAEVALHLLREVAHIGVWQIGRAPRPGFRRGVEAGDLAF